MCILQHTHYEGCGHTHIFSIKNTHNHACPCEQVLHVERQGNCWECAVKEPVVPVMSRAAFEGVLRDAGVTEEEMAAMRNRDRKEGEEGESEKVEGKEEEEVSDNSAQDGDSESRENSEDGHSPKEHGTQVIHYTSRQ
ncbi:hypothetical protein E2P81_ATG10976 [Venturia nashicola]|nr:hypothetical protein E2P81_ATG10976 [Venturia nashicola]